MTSLSPSKLFLGLVIVLALIATAALGFRTADLRCWPGDSCISYIPAAAGLFSGGQLSSMHENAADSLSRLNMRGKEALVLAIALAQRMLSDTTGLFPNILVLLIAAGLSIVLFYLIFTRLFDEKAGLLAAVIFLTCFWPYQYVLLGAHQPFVLAVFLITFYLLLRAGQHPVLFFSAGIFGGLMFFSSPTAVVYLPYFLLIPVTSAGTGCGAAGLRGWRTLGRPGLLVLSGLVLTFVLFTYPRIAENLRGFITYVLTNQGGNHFGYYHELLSAKFSLPPVFRGAGWPWILRYCALIMPVLGIAYLAALAYLLSRSLRERKAFAVLLISLSTPLAVEAAQVAQFGRNYFSWLFGIIFAVVYAFHTRRHSLAGGPGLKKQALYGTTALLLIGHVLFNGVLFFNDVLPARTFASDVSAWLKDHHVKELLVYQGHPQNRFTVDMLQDKDEPQPLRIRGIQSLTQPSSGYVLIPPSRGLTIWHNCVDKPFSGDPVLNELYRTGKLDKVAEVSFPTIASSRVWAQEEEVCAYRDLIRGEITDYGAETSRLYIVDVKKFKE